MLQPMEYSTLRLRGCQPVVPRVLGSQFSGRLFHKVISESGSLLSPWSLYAPGTAQQVAFKLGEAVGVTTNDTALLIEALRSATIEQLVTPGLTFTVDIEYEVAPGDEAFLPAPPTDLILEGKYNDVPLLIGTNSHEGLLNIGELFQGSEVVEYLNEHFEVLLPWHFQSSKEVAEKVKKFYFGEKKLAPETAMQFSNMETDFMFLYPVDKQIKLQSVVSTTPIYYYEFSFDGLLGWDRRSRGDSIPGVPHAEELGYIFYTSYNDPGLAADRPEMVTLARVVKMWTNFVKTGNPTPTEDVLLQNITWNQFTNLDHFYLDIGKDLTVHRNIANDRLGFMTDIYSTVKIPM